MLAIVVLGLLLAVAGGAQADKFAGEFMSMGGGARALGMGGAFAGVANDASALYWNPAGISGFEKRQVLFMHSERFGDLVNYNYAAFAMPTSWLAAEREGAFGLSLIHLGVSDIPIANEQTIKYIDVDGDGVFTPGVDRGDFEGIPRESNNDFALFGTFALKTGYGRVGGSLKLLYTDAIAGVTSTGIGIDLGYLRRNVLTQRFDVGVKLQDITGTYLSWSTGHSEFIAPSVKVGLAYTIPSETLNGSLLLAADADVFFEDRQAASQLWVNRYSTDLHFGAELRFQEKVMVRGGFDREHPTAGAGFKVGFLGFDYAFLHHDDFEATHRVSAMAEF